MTRRTEQLGAAIQRAVQEVIAREIADPRISGLITVTGVRISGDETLATVKISVLPQSQQDLTMHGLVHATEHIRRLVGDRIVVRRMPKLAFELDVTLKKEAEALAAIARAAEERAAANNPPPDDQASADSSEQEP